MEGRCQASLRRLAGAVDDHLTRLAFETERRALLNFGADCSAPAAAYCRVLMADGSMMDGSDGQAQNQCGLRLGLSVMYAGRAQSGTAPEAQRLALADDLCGKVREADARKGRKS